MHFSSRSYSYGGLLRLGEHHISTTTLIKSFSGLANDLKLSKFWLKYIWLELILKGFYLYKIEGQLRELLYSYNGETKNHRVTSRFTLLLCTRCFGKLASYMVQWATINPTELQRIYYHRENVYR